MGLRVSETPSLLPDCASASVKSDESDSRPVLPHPIALSAGSPGGASLALVPADLQWAVPILVDLLKIAGRDLSYESRVFRETARHFCPSGGRLDRVKGQTAKGNTARCRTATESWQHGNR